MQEILIISKYGTFVFGFKFLKLWLLISPHYVPTIKIDTKLCFLH